MLFREPKEIISDDSWCVDRSDTCRPLNGDGNGPRTILEFPFGDVGETNNDDNIFAIILITFNIPRGIVKKCC